MVIKDKSGMSYITVLGGIAGGQIVWAVAFIAVLVQTTVNIDIALILTAVTPIIMAVGVMIQIIGARKAAVIAEHIRVEQEKIKAATQEVHTMVDGQATLEKENRLFEMQERRLILGILVKSAPEHQSSLDVLDRRIVALQAEITEKKETVAALPSVVNGTTAIAE